MDKPQVICHAEQALKYTVFDCKWIPESSKFVTLGSRPNGNGVIDIFEITPSAGVEPSTQIEHTSSLKCGSFGASSPGQKLFATGDFNGNLILWNINDKKSVFKVKAHTGVVNAIDAIGGQGPGPPEVATGGRDGIVSIWDIRQNKKPVVTIRPHGDGNETRDCWAVAFGNSYNDSERVVCSGYDNGDLKLFDLKDSKLIWDKNVKNGVVSVQFDRNDIQMNKLVATTLESKFHLFDCRTLHPKKGFSSICEWAHDKSTVWTSQHLPQNRDIFMTTGGNGSLCLWKYNYPTTRVKKGADGEDVGVMGSVELLQDITISTQPISAFDWCPGKQGLAVESGFDQSVRLVITTKLNLVY